MTVTTSEMRKAAFMADFKAMCAKHCAEVSVEMESGRGWEAYTGAHINVTMHTHRNGEGEVTAEYTDFNINSWEMVV